LSEREKKTRLGVMGEIPEVFVSGMYVYKGKPALTEPVCTEELHI
jgi:hypothetical protein